MPLTAEQKQTVSAWVAAGDNLSVVQKKLAEQFKISMTYMDVRFLVDDLGLELKNAAPKADVSDVSKAAPPPAGPAADPARSRPAGMPGDLPEPGPGGQYDDEDELPEDALGDAAPDALPAAPGGPGGVTLDVDRIVRPGAVVSGSVTFSDGVSGKWALDQYGRLMLDTGKKGYQPSAADVKSFQAELQAQLAKQGY